MWTAVDLLRHRYMSRSLAAVSSLWPFVPTWCLGTPSYHNGVEISEIRRFHYRRACGAVNSLLIDVIINWPRARRTVRMDLLPDTQNGGLRMRRECRERFARHRLQRKPLVSYPSMHHDTYITHVPWCMSGSLTRGGGESVPSIPGACAIRNFTYLTRGP